MKLAKLLRPLTLALLTSGLLQGAAATTPMVLADTVTELKMDWSWDALASSYLGVHWNAWFTPVYSVGDWQVQISYQHLDGPHGEAAEGGVHLLPLVNVAPGGQVFLNGVDDHLGPTPHAGAHTWSMGVLPSPLDGNGNASGGWAFLDVQHVPEPATWLMLGVGLAVVLGARRRAA